MITCDYGTYKDFIVTGKDIPECLRELSKSIDVFNDFTNKNITNDN